MSPGENPVGVENHPAIIRTGNENPNQFGAGGQSALPESRHPVTTKIDSTDYQTVETHQLHPSRHPHPEATPDEPTAVHTADSTPTTALPVDQAESVRAPAAEDLPTATQVVAPSQNPTEALTMNLSELKERPEDKPVCTDPRLEAYFPKELLEKMKVVESQDGEYVKYTYPDREQLAAYLLEKAEEDQVYILGNTPPEKLELIRDQRESNKKWQIEITTKQIKQLYGRDLNADELAFLQAGGTLGEILALESISPHSENDIAKTDIHIPPAPAEPAIMHTRTYSADPVSATSLYREEDLREPADENPTERFPIHVVPPGFQAKPLSTNAHGSTYQVKASDERVGKPKKLKETARPRREQFTERIGDMPIDPSLIPLVDAYWQSLEADPKNTPRNPAYEAAAFAALALDRRAQTIVGDGIGDREAREDLLRRADVMWTRAAPWIDAGFPTKRKLRHYLDDELPTLESLKQDYQELYGWLKQQSAKSTPVITKLVAGAGKLARGAFKMLGIGADHPPLNETLGLLQLDAAVTPGSAAEEPISGEIVVSPSHGARPSVDSSNREERTPLPQRVNPELRASPRTEALIPAWRAPQGVPEPIPTRGIPSARNEPTFPAPPPGYDDLVQPAPARPDSQPEIVSLASSPVDAEPADPRGGIRLNQRARDILARNRERLLGGE